MDAALRWGVVGPGRIAQRFADALRAVPGARLAAVAGRDAARAAEFARRWSSPDAPATVFDSAATLAASGHVDAVYVATPHQAHAPAVEAALRTGVPVLCEKPLAPSAGTAHGLVALARERGVFLMEAVWTRLLPAWAQVRRWVDDGAVGALRTIESSFCFELPYDPGGRWFDPAQAGGALLDIGVYPVTMSLWLAGAAPARFEVTGERAPSGVDRFVEATLHFPGGLRSHFVCGLDREADNRFTIAGEAGRIELPAGFWEAESATLLRDGGSACVFEAPFSANGFEYEIAEAGRCIAAGLVESPLVPHADTLAVLRLTDSMRARLGVRYPFE